MKNLARANVPTVEAGAFPTSKPPPPAPQSIPNLLPSDSVSNIGLPYSVASRSRGEIHHEVSAHNPRPSIVSSTVLPASPNQQQPPTPGVSPLKTFPVPKLQTTNAKIPDSHAYTSVLRSNARTTLDADAVNETSDGREKLSHVNLPAKPLDAEEFGLSLPPKRELPFSKPKSKAGQIDPSNDADNPPVSQTSVENGLSEDRLPPSHTQKSNKRPAIRISTAKQPPAKRSRATGRGKANTKDSAEIVVPSVEELLAQPNKVVNRRVTRSASIIARDAISKDNPNRQQRPPPKVQSLSKKVHITRSTSISNTDGQPSLEVPETCTGTEGDAAVPCTPAYQMIQTHTPRSPGLVEQSSATKHVITGQA
ncbi:hypothetical protein PV10_04405 [Exophiala mesophila]|uniref:Uncharacterized protein n=1 Tax=Exophiala mesophila TaxID=212818 RepID=A0A0D1ZEM3_EXOME|nr:uncharacterized protein PV10_04405 [Exophiala mesophila]KIV93167.1 hypothetical protein PV10_04405 [Exophiala mesophila]